MKQKDKRLKNNNCSKNEKLKEEINIRKSLRN